MPPGKDIYDLAIQQIGEEYILELLSKCIHKVFGENANKASEKISVEGGDDKVSNNNL